MNTLETLSWDSEFFGFGVGKMTAHNLTPQLLEEVLRRMKNEKFQLVYCFADPKDEISNKTLTTAKYELVDKKVTYMLSILHNEKGISENIFSYLHKPINSYLVSLALQSGEYSRFKIDKHFDKSAYENLYTKWLENSLNGTIATDVLVYLEKNKEVGILTLGEKNRRADIGLLAVDETYRRKDIGTQLIKAACQKAEALGFKEIQVVTQKANKGACIFYEKIGFTLERLENIYHIWV